MPYTLRGGQAQTSLHKSWFGGTEKLFLTLPRHGIEPRVFGFEFRLSNHWASYWLQFPTRVLNQVCRALPTHFDTLVCIVEHRNPFFVYFTPQVHFSSSPSVHHSTSKYRPTYYTLRICNFCNNSGCLQWTVSMFWRVLWCMLTKKSWSIWWNGWQLICRLECSKHLSESHAHDTHWGSHFAES